MIQNNELRIGNLLLFENKTLNAATIGTEFCMLSDGTETYDVWYDDLHPVPLTEELLLKLGFELVENCNDESDENYHTWLEKNYDGLGCVYKGDNDAVFCERFDDLQIYNLHQLQNLHFAVTGRELEITNL